MNDEDFKKNGANQNIDPEFVKQLCGINEENLGKNMNDKEKIYIRPNLEEVEKIVLDISRFLNKGDFEILDTLSALTVLMVSIAEDSGMKKYTLLNYISNSWEANHPEN